MNYKKYLFLSALLLVNFYNVNANKDGEETEECLVESAGGEKKWDLLNRALNRKIDLAKDFKHQWLALKRERNADLIDMLIRHHDDIFNLHRKVLNKLHNLHLKNYDKAERKELAYKIVKECIWEYLHMLEQHTKDWDEHHYLFMDKAKKIKGIQKERIEKFKRFLKENL